ncbi:hypothetical protein ABGT15_12095 [Flavobacterium enshiense]|uniref:hypothetical protein n=1 Tax=Flavobacterium enshiense TaxID=1341165 RepID=UPI00345D0C65
MNKKDKIQFYKQQIEICKDMRAIAEQNIAVANRLELEAKSALKLLEANPERAPRGKHQLSDEMKFNLRASLTK